MIRLISAVLYPYRCVESAQTLAFDPQVTVLLGRNEAGKTTVLETLAKANYYDPGDPRLAYNAGVDYPRRKLRELAQMETPPPGAALTYEVEGELLEKIEDDMMLPHESNCFTRVTNYAGGHRVIDNGFEYDPYAFWEQYTAEKAPALAPLRKGLAALHSKEEFESYCRRNQASLDPAAAAALREAGKYVENPHDWENPINEYVFRTYLLPNIPRFLFYDERYMLPGSISLDKLQSGAALTPAERTAKAFLLLAGLDPARLIADPEGRKVDLEIAQGELTESLLRYWRTNHDLRVEFSIERIQLPDLPVPPAPAPAAPQKRRWFSFGKKAEATPPPPPPPAPRYMTNLEIRVKDLQSMVSLPLDQRSKGFNWFFSFWVWLKAIQENETLPTILLLDEPGLHLHADAQHDLNDFLRELAKKQQILLTTHSPYMASEFSGSARLVEKADGGSVITPYTLPTPTAAEKKLRELMMI